jgi:hypothetical protein
VNFHAILGLLPESISVFPLGIELAKKVDQERKANLQSLMKRQEIKG